MTIKQLLKFDDIYISYPLITFELYNKLGYNYLGWFIWLNNNRVSIYIGGKCVNEYLL